MKRIPVFLLALFVLVSCGEKKKEVQETIGGDIFLSAEMCVDCHEPIYNEWKDSMHAKSSPMSDKVHAAVFKMTGNDIKTGTKDGEQPVCVKCHVPLAAIDKEVDITKKKIYAEGITCTFCHKIRAIKNTDKGNIGTDAYEYFTGNNYASAIADTKSGAHGTNYIALYDLSEYCNGCHKRRTNSKGVSVCSTYQEYKTSRKSKFMKCQTCHMASREAKVASSSDITRKVHFHGSSGGHDIDMVKDSLDLNIELSENGKKFSVIVHNKRAAHRLPTSSPLRQLYLKTTQFDHKNKVIKTNYNDSPSEDKKAFFVVAFKDKDGNIGVPPWKAEKIAYDKRLIPDQQRIIMYDLAGEDVKKIKAELFYRLVPEEFAKGKDFDGYTRMTHRVASREIKLK